MLCWTVSELNQSCNSDIHWKNGIKAALWSEIQALTRIVTIAMILVGYVQFWRWELLLGKRRTYAHIEHEMWLDGIVSATEPLLTSAVLSCSVYRDKTAFSFLLLDSEPPLQKYPCKREGDADLLHLHGEEQQEPPGPERRRWWQTAGLKLLILQQ